MPTTTYRALLGTFVLGILAATGCEAPFDSARRGDPLGTFGEVLYREACQRLAYTGQLAQRDAGQRSTVDVSGALGRSVCVDLQAPPADAPDQLRAIVPLRPELVDTLDRLLPKELLPSLQDFLVSMAPTHQDGTTERAILGLGALLENLEKDGELLATLERISTRVGYRPYEHSKSLMAIASRYPGLADVLTNSLSLIGDGGAADAEMKALLRAGSLELRYLAPSSDNKLADFLMTRHEALAAGTPRLVVARDPRGVADVALVDGKVPLPFVDMDRDGLADVDARGVFVDANGAKLDVPTPFAEPADVSPWPRDGQGRALVAKGREGTLYRYLDLDGTMLSGLLRQGTTMFDPVHDLLVGLMAGIGPIMGPRIDATRDYGNDWTLSYKGFDADKSPLLDLVHAGGPLLADKNLAPVLASTKRLFDEHESQTARLVGAGLDAFDRIKKYPDAKLAPQSTLMDELTPILQRILAVPGLAEDLMTALENPHTRGIGALTARLLTAKNKVDFNHVAGPEFAVINTLLNQVPVDRTQPDSDDNRSILQRVAHMMHDANGVPMCNKEGANPSALGIGLGTYGRCALFKVDDVGLFFVLSMASPSVVASPEAKASRYDTTYSKASFRESMTAGLVKALIFDDSIGDALLEFQTGIDGFTRFPSPAAAARSLFLRSSEQSAFMQATMEDARCKDGDRFIDAHDGTLPALELGIGNNPSGFAADNFYDAMRPIIDAFASHDECVQRDGLGRCTREQNAAKIFVDAMSVLHEHWASPQATLGGKPYQSIDRQAPRFAHTDNVVSFEPALAEIFGQTDLMLALSEIAPILSAMTSDGTPGGPRSRDALLALARNLVDPTRAPQGLAYRNGATIAYGVDGTALGPVTPFYLMRDALRGMASALDQLDQASADSIRRALSALSDQLLRVERAPSQLGYRFGNRNFYGLTSVLLGELQSTLADHDRAGDRSTWARQTMLADMTRLLASPMVAGAADFMVKLEADSVARTQLYGLMRYLVDEINNPVEFSHLLSAMGEGVQLLGARRDLVPIAAAMGAAMNPDTGMLDATLNMVKKTAKLDDKQMMVTLMRRLYDSALSEDGRAPLDRISDVVVSLNRAQPGKSGALDAADYASILKETRQFLLDNKRGYLRVVEIVKSSGQN